MSADGLLGLVYCGRHRITLAERAGRAWSRAVLRWSGVRAGVRI